MPSVEDWWIEEFRQIQREWEVRTSHEQQIVNYSLLVLGAVLTFLSVGPFKDLGGWRAPLAFALSTVFLSLGFFYLRHDIFIAYASQFRSGVLSPALTCRYGGAPVLTWDSYLLKRHGLGWRKYLGQLAAVGVCILPMLGPGIALFAFGVLHLGSKTVECSTQAALWQVQLLWIALAISSGLLVLDVVMALFCFMERVRTHSDIVAALQSTAMAARDDDTVEASG